MSNSSGVNGKGSLPEGFDLGINTSERTPVGAADNALPSFCFVLELDTPPRDVIVLQYRSVFVEGAIEHPLLRADACPYLEWQYDEVELADSHGSKDFRHSILFTNGLELCLRFKDFDFATLKPIAASA